MLLADRSCKKVREICKGDVLFGSGKVEIVVKITCIKKQQMLVQLDGGLLITPNHPVWQEGRWVKPHTLAQPALYSCEEVFNFVLDKEHSVTINGVKCVTLGHGLQGENIEHAYFGTQRIVEDL